MPSPINVPITPPRVSFIDPRSGNVSREWYLFFLSLFQLTGGSNVSLDDVQKGPPALTVDEINNLVDKASANIDPSQDGLLAQIAELQKQINDLSEQPASVIDQIAELQKQVNDLSEQPASLIDQIAELQKQVEGLQMTPPPREFNRARYGQFLDTTTQTAAAINTAYAITYNTTDISNGVYLGSPSSRIYVDEPAIYNFLFSIQLDKSSGGTANFWIWPRVNGVDVPNSASQIRIQGNDAELFSAAGFFFNLNAGDYVEFMFEVSDTSVQLASFAATTIHPAIPSIIVTVTDNIQGVQ